MIEYEPRWFGHTPTKPGRLPDAPMEAGEPHTCDPPEAVARCMACSVPAGMCTGSCEPGQSGPAGMKRYLAEKRLKQLLSSGWVNREAICEELGISKDQYYAAIKRLKERVRSNRHG